MARSWQQQCEGWEGGLWHDWQREHSRQLLQEMSGRREWF